MKLYIAAAVITLLATSYVHASQNYSCQLHSGEGPESFVLTYKGPGQWKINGSRLQYTGVGELYRGAHFSGPSFFVEPYSWGAMVRRTAGTWFTYHCSPMNQ